MRASKRSRRCAAVSKEPTPISARVSGPAPREPHKLESTVQLGNPLPVLPLSKSLQKDMACGVLYAAKHIEQVPEVQSDAARRGTEIHDAISAYVQHLMATRQQTDYDALRKMAANSAEDVREILERFTESFIFDPEAVLHVETRLALSAGFEPVDPEDPHAVYAGTPDLVSMLSETECRIDDWKSQFAIASADSFEGMFYPLLMFCHNPALEKITFVLNFVRYGSASRQVTYERSDVPHMQQTAIRERMRQMKLHDGEEPTAAPGRHCAWCPRLLDGCPLAKVSPYTKLTPEQRLAQTAYLKHAYAHSLAVLRDFVIEGGPIEARDDGGNLLRADFTTKRLHFYPLRKANDILADWLTDHPGDGYMMDGLRVSGLSSPLKAKKRAALKDQLATVCEERVQTEFHVGAADEDEEE